MPTVKQPEQEPARWAAVLTTQPEEEPGRAPTARGETAAAAHRQELAGWIGTDAEPEVGSAIGDGTGMEAAFSGSGPAQHASLPAVPSGGEAAASRVCGDAHTAFFDISSPTPGCSVATSAGGEPEVTSPSLSLHRRRWGRCAA